MENDWDDIPGPFCSNTANSMSSFSPDQNKCSVHLSGKSFSSLPHSLIRTRLHSTSCNHICRRCGHSSCLDDVYTTSPSEWEELDERNCVSSIRPTWLRLQIKLSIESCARADVCESARGPLLMVSNVSIRKPHTHTQFI